jgi:hypothetical protein
MSSSDSAPRKAAYAYAHRGEGDMFDMAMGANVPRMRKQELDPNARGPIPILPRDDEAYAALVALRKAARAHFANAYKAALTMPEETKAELAAVERRRKMFAAAPPGEDLSKMIETNNEIEQVALQKLADAPAKQKEALEFLRAASRTIVLDPKAVPLSSLDARNTKLYVLGHGAAGEGDLASSESGGEFSLRDVAQGLKAGGLPPDFESLRLASCNSADTRERNRFLANPPAYSGIFSSRRTAPAQIFANELSQAGFSNPKVTGYQGEAKRCPPGSTAIQEIKNGSSSISERRSRVAKVFTPKRRRALALSCI